MAVFGSIALGTVVFGSAAAQMPVSLTRASFRLIDRAQIVEDVLYKTEGRLLSVRPHADRCTVVVLVFREGERPEKKIFQVSIMTDQNSPN